MYYTISNNNELKEKGNISQLTFAKSYNPTLSNSHRQVHKEKFPDFLPNLELHLIKEAIPLDILPKIGIKFGLLVNEKLKKVLLKFKLPKHHFYPIKVYHSEKVLNYFWLHYIIDDFWEFLDTQNSYSETTKMVTPTTFKVDEIIPILSTDQIIKIKRESFKNRKPLRLGKVTMKKEFPKYDLYEIPYLGRQVIISESLKQEIKLQNITGVEIIPFERFEVTTQ